MIEPTEILEVLQECKRFEKRAREYLDRRKKEASMKYMCYTTKEGGALKRASMDLSRALVAIRE
jgi:hypothetical protein